MKTMAILCAVLVSSVAAIAQTPEEAPDAPTDGEGRPNQDPNEVVCVQEARSGPGSTGAGSAAPAPNGPSIAPSTSRASNAPSSRYADLGAVIRSPASRLGPA